MRKICLGKFISSWGIGGGLLVSTKLDLDSILKQKDFYLSISGNKMDLEISSIKDVKGKMILFFKGFDNINLVQNFIGKKLYFDDNDSNNLYLYELKNFSIIEENKEIGKVEDFMDQGVYISFITKVNGETMNIPNINEFVTKIDDKQKKIFVKNISNLID